MSVPLPHCGRCYYVRVDHDIAIAANVVVFVFASKLTTQNKKHMNDMINC